MACPPARSPRWSPIFAACCRFCVRPQVPISCARTIRARFPGRLNEDRRKLSFRYDPFVEARLWVTIKPKYVNMADINLSSQTDRTSGSESELRGRSGEPIWDII